MRSKEVSAAQPALLLPPPTTVVGALAYPLIRLLELGEHDGRKEVYGNHRLITSIVKHILESTKVASASLTRKTYVLSRATSLQPKRREEASSAEPAKRAGSGAIGLAVHQEFGKLITAPYRGGSSWREARMTPLFSDQFYTRGLVQAVAVQAVGATYGPGAELELVWVFDAEDLARRLGIELEVLDEKAPRAVHGVNRIGSKEGLVALDHERSFYSRNVEVLRPGDVFATSLYVEKVCVEPIDPHLVYEVTLWSITGRPAVYYVPSEFASNNIMVPLPTDLTPRFKLVEPCNAYRLPNGLVGVGR